MLVNFLGELFIVLKATRLSVVPCKYEFQSYLPIRSNDDKRERLRLDENLSPLVAPRHPAAQCRTPSLSFSPDMANYLFSEEESHYSSTFAGGQASEKFLYIKTLKFRKYFLI